MLLRKLKAFFFYKYSSRNFLIFPNSKIFWLFCKKTQSKQKKKKFLRINIILYEFCSKFATLTNFEKKSYFFFKITQRFFPKNPKFRTYLKNLTISVAFYSKFSIIWWWKIWKSKPLEHLEFGHFQLASKRKNKMFALNGWFSFHI